MLEQAKDGTVIILYALAAISGGLGGCAVTAHHFLKDGSAGKVQMRASWLVAYAIVGSVFGLLFAIYGAYFIDIERVSDIIGPSLIAGIVGSASLGGVNVGARFILKHLGVEVVVTVRRGDEERRNENEHNKDNSRDS